MLGLGMGIQQSDRSGWDPPRCGECDDVIGVYEPLIHLSGGAACADLARSRAGRLLLEWPVLPPRLLRAAGRRVLAPRTGATRYFSARCLHTGTDGAGLRLSQDWGVSTVRRNLMAITVPNPTSPTESVAGYHAAVVHEFNAPLTVEQVPWRELHAWADPRSGRGMWALPHRHPRGPRGLANQAIAALHSRS